jgi:hypothetical protein
MVVGQQQDGRPQQDPLGRGRDERQAFQRVGDRKGRRELHGARLRPWIYDDVLGDVERLKAALLGMPGQRGHVVRVEAVDGGVVADPELHRIPPMRPGSQLVTVDDDRCRPGGRAGATASRWVSAEPAESAWSNWPAPRRWRPRDVAADAGAVYGASEASAAPLGALIIRFRAVPGSSLI